MSQVAEINDRLPVSNQVVRLLTRAAQALESGQAPRMSLEAGAEMAGEISRESASPSRAASLAPTKTREDANSRRVCRALKRVSNAIGTRDQERWQFVALAAHDLKTPLMVIGGMTRAMKEPDLQPQEQQECLDCLLRNVVSLEHIVADLLDNVQAETGQLKLKVEKLNLTALASEVVDDFSATVKSHPFEIEGSQDCIVEGDPERLKRVLWNLLSNSAKYSAAGGVIKVSVWRCGESVRLAVQDRGVGVAPSDVERMFLPFKRLDHSRDMASGTGLGLLSVQRIVEAHGGEITVQGARHEGLCVEIRFRATSVEELN